MSAAIGTPLSRADGTVRHATWVRLRDLPIRPERLLPAAETQE